MPIVSVQTNLSDREVPADFNEGFSKLIAEVLNKPEARITVSVTTNVRMCRAGSRAPTVLIQMWSIDVFGPEKNKQYGPRLLDYVGKSLNLTDDRITMVFHPIHAYDVATR